MKKLIASCVVFFCFLSGGVPAQESTITLYLRGSQLEQNGDYNGAYDIYKRILKTEKSPTIYIKMADIEVFRGNYDAAHELLKTALREFPLDDELTFSYGLFIMKRAERAEDESSKKLFLLEAQKAFKDAVDIKPSEKNLVALAYISETLDDYPQAVESYYKLIRDLELTEYYGSLGLMKIKMGKKEEGVKDLELAAENGDLQSILALADIARKDEDTDALVKYLKMASELNPDLFMPDMYIGDVYVNNKEYDKAIHFYLQASNQLAGEQKSALLKQVGALALQTEDFESALDAYQRALDATPEDTQLYYMAGYSAGLLGDFDAAQGFYDEGLKVSPDYAMLRKRSALNLLMLGRTDDAEHVISKIDPIERDLEYYLILSNIYSDKGDRNRTIETLKEGLKENPLSAELYITIAFEYDKDNKFTEAEAALLKVLEFEANNATALNFLGYMYADRNVKLDEAEELIDRALEIDSQNYAFIDSKAWVLYRKGKYKEAYKYMQEAYRLNPDDPEIIEHMKAIEKKIGK